MTFFERGDEHVRTYAQVHDGEGADPRPGLELEPGVSEGDHTHPSDDPADNWEELYYVLEGTGTLTVDGSVMPWRSATRSSSRPTSTTASTPTAARRSRSC
jgi:hypothetical protein